MLTYRVGFSCYSRRARWRQSPTRMGQRFPRTSTPRPTLEEGGEEGGKTGERVLPDGCSRQERSNSKVAMDEGGVKFLQARPMSEFFVGQAFQRNRTRPAPSSHRRGA